MNRNTYQSKKFVLDLNVAKLKFCYIFFTWIIGTGEPKSELNVLTAWIEERKNLNYKCRMANKLQNNKTETEWANWMAVNARRGWGEERKKRMWKKVKRILMCAQQHHPWNEWVIYDMVLEHADWLQSLEVNMRSFRGRFGIECEDCVCHYRSYGCNDLKIWNN